MIQSVNCTSAAFEGGGNFSRAGAGLKKFLAGGGGIGLSLPSAPPQQGKPRCLGKKRSDAIKFLGIFKKCLKE